MNEQTGNVKKAGSLYLIGSMFNKGIGFITVPIFTRILTVEDYGIVTTYNSWVSIMSIFVSLALYMAVRSSFIDYKTKERDFLSVILSFTLLYGSCIAGIVIILVYLLPFSVSTTIIALCMLQSLSSAIIENTSMYLMMKYQYKARTAIMILPNLIATIIAVIIIKYCLVNKLYLGRIVPMAFTTAIFGIVLCTYIFRNSKIHFNKEYLSYGLKISVPLVLHGIALNILSQSDRTMITYIRNATETGIYGLIYNFSMIATVLTTALDGVWVPYFTTKMAVKSYTQINGYSKKYIKFMTVVIIGVILIAPEIVKVLATEPYWEGITIIPPIVLANYLIFLYTMYVNVEHYHKKTVFISINTAIAAITNIVLNFIFIKEYGYIGAAYSTLISYIVSLILHYLYSKRLNKELFPIKQVIIPFICIGIIVVLFYILISCWYARWGIALICLAYVLISEKEWIIKFIKRGK